MMQIKEGSKFYDNTMISSYKECPRRFFLRHRLNWRSQGTAIPLVFGLSWHSGMDMLWKVSQKDTMKNAIEGAMLGFLEQWESSGMPAQLDVNQIDQYSPRTPTIAHEMFTGYAKEREHILLHSNLIACEQPFAVPMPGLVDIWYIGRLDKVVEYNGQQIVVEHKTTTEYKKDGFFKSTYVEGWFSDSQVKGYQFGGGLFFPGLTQVWVDAALVHKTVHNGFRFIPVAHQFPLLQEWITGTREWIVRLTEDDKRFEGCGELPGHVFPKNESSCMGKFGACAFLDVCRSTPDPTKIPCPEGYIVEPWTPFETLGLDQLIQKATNEKHAVANSTEGPSSAAA